MENRLADLLSRPANKNCIDCGSAHPQWASLNNCVFFCLECSGIHRSLGVQTSFVRSVTMDRWTSEQVSKMESGGNDRALQFWKSRPDWREGLPIKEKYNSDFARKYRDLLNGVTGRAPTGNSFIPSAAPTPGVKQVYSSHSNTSIAPSSTGSSADWFSKIKQQVSSSLIEPVKQYVASSAASAASQTPKATPSSLKVGKESTEKKPQEDDSWSW